MDEWSCVQRAATAVTVRPTAFNERFLGVMPSELKEQNMTPEDEEFEAITKRQLAEQKAKKPAKRGWVGLTDEEVNQIADSEWEEAFVRLIEAKLKEKNT